MTTLTRELVESVGLAEFRFPADPREGRVTFRPDASIKIDQAKPHGTDEAKTTVVGKNPVGLRMTLEWSYRISAESRAFIRNTSPRGPNSGKPLEVTHPDCELYHFDSILIQKQGPIERSDGGQWGKIEYECVGWDKRLRAANNGKGAIAPKKAAQAAPSA